MIRSQIEPSRDFALIRSAAHQLGPSAPTQHKAQRIKQDRFTGTRFSGQHIEPGLERKFQPVDDQHVPDIETREHTTPFRSRSLQPTALNDLAVNLTQPAISRGLKLQPTSGQQFEAVVIPIRTLVVEAQDRTRRLGFIGQSQ